MTTPAWTRTVTQVTGVQAIWSTRSTQWTPQSMESGRIFGCSAERVIVNSCNIQFPNYCEHSGKLRVSDGFQIYQTRIKLAPLIQDFKTKPSPCGSSHDIRTELNPRYLQPSQQKPEQSLLGLADYLVKKILLKSHNSATFYNYFMKGACGIIFNFIALVL